MRSTLDALRGVYDLAIHPRTTETTDAPIDPALFLRWTVEVARASGLEVLARATERSVARLIVRAPSAASLNTLGRWVPVLRARPLPEVASYASAVVRLRRAAGYTDEAREVARLLGALSRGPSSPMLAAQTPTQVWLYPPGE